MIRRPPRSPLFPSTPLSRPPGQRELPGPWDVRAARQQSGERPALAVRPQPVGGEPHATERAPRPLLGTRSEEHTSELQSRQYLVCRLLLEKKKNQIPSIPPS